MKVDEWDFERWEFTGRELEELEQGRYEEEPGDEGIGQDRYYPMMLYAYPIEDNSLREEIREVHKKTNCTVVKKRDTGQYFLALTGGGMNLSQDIARAYLIVQGWIPSEWAKKCHIRAELTQHGEGYLKVLEGCREALVNDRRVKKIDEQLEKIEKEN